MKSFLIIPALVSGLFAQTALEKAEQDLRLAEEQLRTLEIEITKEESTLVRAVEAIDDRVIEQHKTLTKLLKDEDNLAGQQRELNNELARRKGEFEFTMSSLRSYGSSLRNRLHPAEKQSFGQELETVLKRADSSGGNLSLEIQRRLSVLALAADRIKAISGGQRLEGQAVGSGNVVKKGRLATAGPLGYFASDDGSTAGLTTFSADGVDFPTIIALPDGAAGIADLVKNGQATVPVDASMGKAIQVARSQKTIGEYLKGGGLVGYAIVALGLVALLIALFKLVEIQRFPLPSRKKINLIVDDLLAHEVESAKEKAAQCHGLGREMVEAGITYYYDKRRILEDALLEKLGLIQPKLERLLPFLALAAAAAPMMGLLGTVLGIMKTFAMMSAVGSGDSRAFSAGISEALITTAMGLIVAIPVIIIHGMLKSRAKGKFAQAEGVALALLNSTTEMTNRPAHESDGDSDDPDDLDETELVTA